MSQKKESDDKTISQLEEKTLFEIIELDNAALDAVTGGGNREFEDERASNGSCPIMNGTINGVC